MSRVILQRIVDAIPTMLLVLTLVFLALHVLPGDPAQAILGDQATPSQLALVRAKLGLDRPLLVQYLTFILNVLELHFGSSYMNNLPIRDIVWQNLPYTMELTAAATVLGVAMGVPLGVLSATRRGRVVDYAARLAALLGFAVPDFFLGALLLIFLSLELGWFPINGAGQGLWDGLYHLFLPALALGLIKAAFVSRLTRSTLLDVLGRNYVRTARAKGAREWRVVYLHALRNALVPVATGLGLSILSTLSGSVAIELIFGRPGLGRMLVDAIATRDYPIVQAGLVVFSLFVVLVNLLMDLVNVLLDPRIRGRIAVSQVGNLFPTESANTDAEAPWRTAGAALLRNRVTLACLILLAALALLAIFAPEIAPYNPVAQSLLDANLDPSPRHVLGTDQFGRDVLSRIIFGTRASLLLGLTSPAIAAACGGLLGVAAGYFGGLIDRLIGRLTDLLLAFPALLIGIMVAAALGPGFWELVAALAVSFAPRFARIARASTLSVRAEPFVEAAIAVGLTHPRIVVRHVLPNIAGPIVVVLTLWVATAIRLEATLSFLGLGTQAPQPSWGNIIRDGLDNLFGSPWPIVCAGAAITVTALAFSLIGDAVRDVLDPELRE